MRIRLHIKAIGEPCQVQLVRGAVTVDDRNRIQFDVIRQQALGFERRIAPGPTASHSCRN